MRASVAFSALTLSADRSPRGAAASSEYVRALPETLGAGNLLAEIWKKSGDHVPALFVPGESGIRPANTPAFRLTTADAQVV
jgi:hypothetical protein